MRDRIGPQEWYQAFRKTVRQYEWGEPLREAATAGKLGDWTRYLTGAVVATCASFDWMAVGLGHEPEVLPVSKQEYLAIDVMAFSEGDYQRWRTPVAVFELENRPEPAAVSYSLWKVTMVRAALRCVFCYRRQPEGMGALIADLTQGVMTDLYHRDTEVDPLLLVVGTRSKAESFPDGFFKPYEWGPATRQFRLLW